MVAPTGQIGMAQRLRPKGIADVVICIDCTGSMQNCIEGVKSHVQDLVRGFEQGQNLKLDWRVRLIEYRDLPKGEPIREYPFTTSIEEFRRQVEGLRADGGGDEPESTLDAIFVAARSEWRAQCNKCIVVFTDATTHSQMHGSTVKSGQARDVNEVINALYEKRARLFLYGPADKMYDELASAERVQYKEVAGDSGLAGVDFAKIMEAIGKTVSASTEAVKAE